MLISGKAEEWSMEDLTVDVLLIYRGDNVYSPMDVGTYIQTHSFMNILKFNYACKCFRTQNVYIFN